MRFELTIETTPSGSVADPEGLVPAHVHFNGEDIALSQVGFETQTISELCRLLEFKVRARS